MIADNFHGHQTYKNLIRNYLEYWSTNVIANTENKPQKLVLILEQDSLESFYLNNYLLTGNFEDLLEHDVEGLQRAGGLGKIFN